MDISDAKDVLRCQMRLASNFTTSPGSTLSRRKRAKRSLGAGAFMKDETLRGIDGRILRQGKFDCGAASRRRILDDTFSSPNARPFSSDATHEPTPRRRRPASLSRSEFWDTHHPRPPKTPPPTDDDLTRIPILSPSGSSDSDSVSSDDGVLGSKWDECSPEWYRAHCALRMMQDTHEADEMFRQFIDADQCDDTVYTE